MTKSLNPMFGIHFDYLVVGAGSAGCVMASRLSEDPNTRVCLVEAGPDWEPGAEPETVRDLYPMSFHERRFLWPDTFASMKVPRPGVATSVAHEQMFEQGRLMGGGSSLMGMFALRGLPGDYDEWQDAGAAGWAWSDVLPYFKKLESDTDFAGATHGSIGPVPIRRIPKLQWPAFTRAVTQALSRRGMRAIDDFNADFDDGYGALPLSNLASGRVSSATAYLSAAVRRRTNLLILSEAHVHRVVVENRQAIGVELVHDGILHRVNASEVILSAGALRSPAMLMRAGIGDDSELRELGVSTQHHLPGVGCNLQNHARIYVASHLKRSARQQPDIRPVCHATARYTSGVPRTPAGDMLLVIVNKAYWHRLGTSIAGLGPTIYKPYSRGRVMLASADPTVAPRIQFRLLSEERDLRRLVNGLGFALDLFQSAEVSPLCNETFVPRPNAWVRRLGWLGWRNRLEAAVAAVGLDAMGSGRRIALSLAGTFPEQIPRDAAELDQFVYTLSGHMFHPAGTCRMGLVSDSHAVVDSQCRVHGVRGFRVVDASVMPTLPRANTNIPTIMIAEKVADGIRRHA